MVHIMRIANIVLSLIMIAVYVAAVPATTEAAILDFTDISGAGAPGTVAGSFKGIDYNLSSSGGPVTFNGVQDGSSCITLACTGDGLGVGDGEVSAAYFFLPGDVLRIDFGEPLTIKGVFLLDLYSSIGGTEKELAHVAYNGGSVDIFADPGETPDGDSGFQQFLFASAITTDYLEFSAPKVAFINDQLGVNDFAVGGILATPLPAALPLFGTGLGLMGLLSWWRRRRVATI